MKAYVLSGAILLVCGGFGACQKNAAKPEEASEAIKAYDTAHTTNSTKALSGVDTSGLSSRKKKRLSGLANTLPSPCGKAHSLRVSLEKDKTCKRSKYAAAYVVMMLKDDWEDADVRDIYDKRYGKTKTQKIEVNGTPHTGPADAKVVVVEFYDYGCGSCKEFKPLLEAAVGAFPGDVAVYYKQFPLVKAHPYSFAAAQAALAAGKQGKFKEFHNRLFAVQTPMGRGHSDDKLREYAKALGLDMARFEADFKAAKTTVSADMKQGDSVGVKGTPTVYINGRKYSAPGGVAFLKSWIEEEIALQ